MSCTYRIAFCDAAVSPSGSHNLGQLQPASTFTNWLALFRRQQP